MNSGSSRTVRYTFFLLGIFLSLYGLILVKEFLYPVVFGFLLAYLLYPLSSWLERKYVPRILSILISEFFIIAILYGIGLFMLRQFGKIIDDIPALRQQATENINLFLNNLEEYLGLADDRLAQLLKGGVESLFRTGDESFNEIFRNIAGLIVKIGLLPVYIFLFLYYRTKFAYFILKMVPKQSHLDAIRALRGISTVATKYMGGMFIVVLILMLINSIGLSLIGIKYPILIGITVAMFSFIPYFGNLIGGGLAVAFSLLTMDSPVYALEIAVMFFLVHTFENNVLSPNIVGNTVEINPFFIILGLVAASMVWGVPGMLVIMPILAITKIICENIPALTPYAYLLGPKGTGQHAPTLRNMKRSTNRFIRFVKRFRFKKD